jgi:hypothetical protein
LIFLAACQSGSGEGVREIRDGNGPNAGMVRNPISANTPLDTNQLARIRFAESEFDFGMIQEGEVVEHKFKFTNVGNVPLTILNARASCGCTTPEWSQEPISPGGTGEILARFNSAGRTDQQDKTIYVTANTFPNESEVKIRAFVKKK